MDFDILSIESFFPKKKEKFKNKNLINKTGIKNRFVSSAKEDVIVMATNSTKKILIKKKIKVDFLLFVTQTSPYKLPSASCVLQGKLGLEKNVYAIDINMGCSGFVYALSVAKGLFATNNNFKNGLIVCADNYTKYINKSNKSCYPIFSDVATTIHLKKKNKNVSRFDFGTDGNSFADLILKNSDTNIYMNGSKVALFTLYEIPNFINKFLEKIKLNKNKVKMFILHQASKFVIDNLVKKLEVEKKKVPHNFDLYGNTVSSTIPLLLKDLDKKGKIRNGDNIILSGFGVGLSWAACFIKWKKLK
jgi:3-oxoacyl-[acyl-carrier-protein] synthase-3